MGITSVLIRTNAWGCLYSLAEVVQCMKCEALERFKLQNFGQLEPNTTGQVGWEVVV